VINGCVFRKQLEEILDNMKEKPDVGTLLMVSHIFKHFLMMGIINTTMACLFLFFKVFLIYSLINYST